jgi:HAD superfamily hydrolase (TIGR01549 family)
VEVLRASVRELWRGEAPAPDFRARVNVSASDGLSADFAGAHPALAEIRAFLPRFRAAALGDRLERWRRARWAAQDAYPHAHELLASLRGRFRLGLVTNGPSDQQRRKLAHTGLAEHFDAVVASCDIGVGKPEPAIFAAALDALGVAAADAVMVGNDKGRDVGGAAAAGIRGIWIQHGGGGDVSGLAELPALL